MGAVFFILIWKKLAIDMEFNFLVKFVLQSQSKNNFPLSCWIELKFNFNFALFSFFSLIWLPSST